jgi:hypothetical protein
VALRSDSRQVYFDIGQTGSGEKTVAAPVPIVICFTSWVAHASGNEEVPTVAWRILVVLEALLQQCD